MKNGIYLALALATAVSLSGCDTPQGQNAAGGAVIGGATGALLGSALSHGSPGGVVVGAMTGAAAGAMVGSSVTPQQPGYAPPPRSCAEWYYDYYGNRVCRAYY